MATRLRPAEERVRVWLQGHIGVPVDQHDDGSAPSMFDLTIERGAGEAVEIVSNATGSVRQAMEARRKHLPDTAIAGLAFGWRIRPTRHAVVRDLAARAHAVLTDLEARGLLDSNLDDATSQALRSRGIAHARVDASLRPGEVRFVTGVVDVGYAASVEDLPAVVERVLAAHEDVCKKLRSSGMERCHAVIVISADDLSAALALDDESALVPARDPGVPVEIDEVWLFPEAPASRVLHWQRGGGWSDTGRTPS